MAQTPKNNVCVLGGGMWGVVLAQHLASQGSDVKLWEFSPQAAETLRQSRQHPHIPGFKISTAMGISHDLTASISGCSVLLFVLPSHVLASTAKAVSQSGAVGRGTVAINASKGIEPHTMATMGDVIAREVPALRGQVWTLTGPSFAREVAAGIHTNLILGGRMNAKSKALAALFNGGCLRVSNWPDRVGVELGGSLKNVVAVGAGILDGLGAGANTKAALLVRGLGEMSQLIAACKGRADTVYGLSGLGDLIATGTSAQSRNRTFGEKLGQGLSPKQALAEIPTVVEGIEAAQSAVTLCRQHKVKAPLISAIHAATIGGHPRQVLAAMGFV